MSLIDKHVADVCLGAPLFLADYLPWIRFVQRSIKDSPSIVSIERILPSCIHFRWSINAVSDGRILCYLDSREF